MINLTASAFNARVADVADPIAIGWVRLAVAAIALAALTRVRVRRLRYQWRFLAIGAVVAGLNVTYYVAATRISLGAVTTLGLVGPIGLAVALSRTRRQLVGAVLAAVGVVAIAAPWQTAFDAFGVAVALSQAALWVWFIFLAQQLGRSIDEATLAVIALGVAAVLLTPAAVAVGGFPFTDGRATITLLLGGVLGAALPYVVEMRVLRALSARRYGLLQSLYPVIGAGAGLVVLHQHLSRLTLAGMALVSVAAGLAAARRRGPAVAR